MTYLTCRIEIGERVIHYPKRIEIRSSWRELTDTAEIAVAAKGDVRTLKGERVRIELGYDYRWYLAYEGEVARVENDVLHCEDVMYRHKRQEVKGKAYRKATIKQVLLDAVPNLQVGEIADVTIGAWRHEAMTAAALMKLLSEKTGVTIFYRDNRLYAGPAYTLLAGEAKTHRVVIGRNTKRDELSAPDSDRKLLVDVVIHDLDGGEVRRLKVGDEGGDKRTVHYFGVSDSEAKQRAEVDLEKMKATALTGSVTLFGRPSVRFGDVLEVTTKAGLTERVLVDEVTMVYDSDGLEQQLEIGYGV